MTAADPQLPPAVERALHSVEVAHQKLGIALRNCFRSTIIPSPAELRLVRLPRLLAYCQFHPELLRPASPDGINLKALKRHLHPGTARVDIRRWLAGVSRPGSSIDLKLDRYFRGAGV